MNKIRVLQMIDRSILGGGQAVLMTLAKGLDKERFDVSVCAAAGGPLVDEVRRFGLVFHPVGFRGKPNPGLTGEIRRVLRDNRIDVLHTHGGFAGVFGRRAAIRAGTPVVVHTIHGIHYLHYRNRILKRLLILLERRQSRRTDAVVLVSEADLAQAARHKLAGESRLRLIRNGIEARRFVPGPEGERRLLELRTKLKLDPPVVGSIARLHRQKGIINLLLASEAVGRVRPEARIVVIGGGPLENKMRRFARDKGWGRSVSLLGARGDAADFLPLFDVFVLPSLWEGLPLVLIEAAASGKPIVATDIGGVREVIRPGETGLLVPPGEPGALAEAILRLLGDPVFARRLADRARAEIPPRYSAERMISEYAALYLELAGKKQAPGFD
jgi:glycosyltransferase involved in cell wall biosynthesis